MDIQHLKYFVQVIKNQSFTKAAEKLVVTQPMLSRVINQLEEELDVKLIERTSKHFKTTDAGELLYQQALKVLHTHNDIYQYINDLKSAKSGEVLISIPGVLLDMYFPPLLFEFHQKYPHVKLDIIEEGSKLTAQSVLSDQVELGFVMLPVRNASKLTSRIVTTSICHVLVNKEHRFAKRSTPIHTSELVEERIITFSTTATLHDAVIRHCENEGFEPNIVYKTLMPNFIFEMVHLGLCIGILPYPVVKRFIFDGLVSIPLEPKIIWEISVISKKGNYLSFAARNFLSFVEEYSLKNEKEWQGLE